MNQRRQIIPYNPYLIKYARQLRNHSTKSEILLWHFLKNKQLLGYDFHRQKPVENYILDFFCHEVMLGIELDGSSHLKEEVKQKDIKKEEDLARLGITVLRFDDAEVLIETEFVLKKIERFILDFEAKTGKRKDKNC